MAIIPPSSSSSYEAGSKAPKRVSLAPLNRPAWLESTKEVQNKPGFRRSPAGLSGQIEFGVFPAKNRCFSRRNATFLVLEAGGIEIVAEKREKPRS